MIDSQSVAATTKTTKSNSLNSQTHAYFTYSRSSFLPVLSREYQFKTINSHFCRIPMQTSSVIHSAKPLWSPIKPKPLHTPLVVPQRKTLSFRVKSLYTLPPKDTTFDDRSSAGSMATPPAASPKWAQKTVTLPPLRRGCHLVTSKILKEIALDLSGFKCGLAHVFLQHTSASLTINENYDTDVRDDTETFLNKIVPEGRSAPWKHTLEGPDDMPAHIKSSMFGCNLTIPITDGRLNMGTWQGIWLCEHRDEPTARRVVVTLNGV